MLGCFAVAPSVCNTCPEMLIPQVYLEIDDCPCSQLVTARVARYRRSDNTGFVYHLADMQGIFEKLKDTCVVPSARSDGVLQLSVTSNGASIARLDKMLKDPQAEVCIYTVSKDMLLCVMFSAGCNSTLQSKTQNDCLQAPNYKSQAITDIICINGGFVGTCLPALHESLEPSLAWLMFNVNGTQYEACIPVRVSKLKRPDLPTGMVYNIHQLAHVTAWLASAQVVHWYKVNDRPTIMAAVSAAHFTAATAEAFGRALLNAASPKPDLPVRC